MGQRYDVTAELAAGARGGMAWSADDRRRGLPWTTGRRGVFGVTCFGVVLCGVVMGQVDRQYARAEVAMVDAGLTVPAAPVESAEPAVAAEGPDAAAPESAEVLPAAHRDHAAWVFDR